MRKSLLAAAFLSLSLAPAYADIPPPNAPKIHTAQVTPQSQGEATGEVTIGVGDTLNVRLRQQAGTGYAWSFDEASAGPELQFGGASVEPKTGGAIGGGQIQVFQFYGSQAGAKALTFSYARADAEPAQTYVLTVTVGE